MLRLRCEETDRRLLLPRKVATQGAHARRPDDYTSLRTSVFCRTDGVRCSADTGQMSSFHTPTQVRQRHSGTSGTSITSAQVIGGSSTREFRDASSLRVLLVDDCPIQQLLSSALLSKWGIRPEFASDGLEAVLLAGEQRFDLILMDIQMGVLDGVAATTRIRLNERRNGTGEVPIVAYTAEPIPDCQRAWADAGITASLAKPCQPAEMGECLMRWCGVPPEPLRHWGDGASAHLFQPCAPNRAALRWV